VFNMLSLTGHLGELWQLHAWIGEGECPTQQEGTFRAVDA
jgi:hypothetical protein